MSESNKEQLSALIDGEHDSNQPIDKLMHNKEMQSTWSRYHLIGDCLRDNLPEQISNQVYNEVNKALSNEPTVLAPTRQKQINLKPLAGFAIAASVAMAAVFTIQNNNQIDSPINSASSIAATSVSQPETFNFSEPQVLPASVNASDTPESVADQRLNNYLMNHNEYRSSNGMNGILPYVRIVTIESQE